MTSLSKFATDNRKVISTLFLIAFALALFCVLNSVNAGSEGKEFSEVYDKITGWAQGTLGKILALTCIVVGTAFTISRGTLIYAVIGIAMCLVLYNAPTVIDGILSATVNADTALEPVKAVVTNGLLK